MPEQPTQLEDHRPPRDLLTVTVNGHKVFFHVHKASGAEIKSTAIAQHVQIQLDFNLFERDRATLSNQSAMRTLSSCTRGRNFGQSRPMTTLDGRPR